MNCINEHNTRAKDDLRLRGELPENWVPVLTGTDHDVLIVGGGQSGISIATALRRYGITRISVIDAALPSQTGSWRTKARMRQLRTSKKNIGPELGIPSLSFQAWYEAQAGRPAYDAMAFIPTETWVAYLDWLKDITDTDIRYNTRLLHIHRENNWFRVTLQVNGDIITCTTRKIVMATGIAGCGTPFIPASIKDNITADHYVHTDAPINLDRFKNQRLIVVGAGSSAFDTAAAALEKGAASVDLLCRHERLISGSNMVSFNYPGAQDNFYELPDAVRWELAWFFRERAPGPPPATVTRATQHPNFRLHLNVQQPQFKQTSQGIDVVYGQQVLHADAIIAGTGYQCDLSLRPEFADIGRHIATWRDVYNIPVDEQSRSNASAPYLGPGYQLQEKHPGHTPWIKDIYCFNFAGITSFGRHVGDVGSIKEGVPRLVRHLSKDFFLADLASHLERLHTTTEDELSANSYLHAVFQTHTAATPEER